MRCNQWLCCRDGRRSLTRKSSHPVVTRSYEGVEPFASAYGGITTIEYFPQVSMTL
jgi:hypothetical protein